MGGHCFLATFRPLILTAAGRAAAQQHSLPSFIDGSCRREPDFESSFPSITASCRTGNFAPRLGVGDRVVYLTVKAKYGEDTTPGRRLVAILRILQRFSNHAGAAQWYTLKDCELPSNCLVPDNPPKAFEVTNGNPPVEVKKRVCLKSDAHFAVRLWDATYRQRISKWPVLLATTAEFLELRQPPQLRDGQIVGYSERFQPHSTLRK